MKQSSSWQRLTAIIALCSLITLLTTPVQAVEKQQIILAPPTQAGDKLSLQWWVEGLRQQTVIGTELLANGAAVVTQSQLEPTRNQSVCYLLMVDTSKSMVAKHTTVNREDIKALLVTLINAKPAVHTLGLMTFSTQATTVVKPTLNTTPLLGAVENLQFDQARTELFRFVENGIKELKQCPTHYRRVLVLISDGISEDQSYDEADAVQFARENQTSIYSFIIKDSSSLQNPLYLAEKTGGWGSEPTSHNALNRAETIANLYTSSHSGGALQATLPTTAAVTNVQLRLTLSDGKHLSSDVPLTSPLSAPVAAWKQALLNALPGTANQLNYVLGGGGLLLLLLVGFTYRATRSATPSAPLANHQQPVGFLVHHGQSYPVYTGTNTIGFLPSNTIVIDDDTVGRAHATLHYQEEGDVILTDLHSLNGSWVNNERIQHPTRLRDGDSIALGEWQASYQRAR